MLSSIQNHISAHPWCSQIQYFSSIDSTNSRAKQMALAGAPHGTVLVADHQTGGRGRMGRSFSSPAGMGIYMSVILRPQCSPAQLMHLTCAAAVAACNAITQATGLQPQIKWTNDLILENRKIAGILTELVTTGDQTCAIIGIGINCCQQEADFPEEIRSFAGSLSMFHSGCVDRSALSAALVQAFSHMSQTLFCQRSAIMDRYRTLCITLGKEVSVVRADQVRHATALSVNDDGALLVRFPDGSQEAVASGEVSIRGMYGYI